MCLFSLLKSLLSIKQVKQTKRKNFYHKNQIYWWFHFLRKRACANSIYFTPIRIRIYRMEFQKTNKGCELCCPKGACAIVKYTVPRHTCTYHKEEMSRTFSYICRNCNYLSIEQSGWMGSVIYGLGADLSLPRCLLVTTGIWTSSHKSEIGRASCRERG